MHRGNRRLQRVRAEPARRQRAFHQSGPFGNQIALPERAVLVAQQDELAGRRRTRGAARFVQQHQRQQAHHLGLGQELAQQPSQADGLAGQIVPRQGHA